MWAQLVGIRTDESLFQYRKRYAITCDEIWGDRQKLAEEFQYRKRYEITCDVVGETVRACPEGSFNTASGMRSHVTP